MFGRWVGQTPPAFLVRCWRLSARKLITPLTHSTSNPGNNPRADSIIAFAARQQGAEDRRQIVMDTILVSIEKADMRIKTSHEYA